MKLAYYCPGSAGGITDYTYAQAAALSAIGVDVTLLLPRHEGPANPACTVQSVFENESRSFGGPRLVRQIRRSALICGNMRRLTRAIAEGGFDSVLLASYIEYAAPLWSGELTRMAHRGISFGANLHDPIRDHVAGPAWWHGWSIRRGYSFLSHIFVHEAIDRAEAGVPDHVRVTVVPHGPYDFPASRESPEEARARLGIPPEAKLMLSFGHIRDGKNLDLILRAMVEVPEVWLLVAGNEAGGVHRPLQYYRKLANDLGVASRCRWLAGHVKSQDVGGIFSASDVSVMAYSRAFRSASGVLNTAVRFRKLSIASSGAGPLKTQIHNFGIGIWVEPDSVDALVAGLKQWLRSAPDPRWEDYENENSWRRNAEIVADRFLRPQ